MQLFILKNTSYSNFDFIKLFGGSLDGGLRFILQNFKPFILTMTQVFKFKNI